MTKKTYSIEIEETSSGITIKRRNDGFNGFELLGFLAMIESDVLNQVRGVKQDKLKYVEKTIIKQK